jgi:tetratricopeptide (TPR) repeat protein
VSVRIVAGVCLPLAGLVAWVYAQDYRARRHLEEARRAIERRNFSEASRQLERCLEIRPKRAANQFLAARTARRADAFDQAQEHLTKAEQLGWDPEAVRLERFLLQAQQGELPEGVERSLQQRSRRGPKDPEAPMILEALTKFYLQRLKAAQARDCLKRWRQLEPENIDMLLWEGWLWQEDADPVKALQHFERAVQLDPDNNEAVFRLAQLLLSTNQPRKVVGSYEQLRTRLPGQPAILLGLSKCRIELHELDEAKQLLDEILNDSRFAEVLGPTGQGPPRLPEQLDPATRAWLDQLMRLAPYDLRRPSYLHSMYAEALVERSKIAIQEEDDAQAESWLRQAVQIQPTHREAILKLWQCLEKRGRLDEAQQYRAQWQQLKDREVRAKELVRRSMNAPPDPNALCELADVLLTIGHEAEALAWLEIALRKDPRHQRTRQLLQEYHDRTGDPMAAGILHSVGATR